MVVLRREERRAKVGGIHVIADGKSQRRASRESHLSPVTFPRCPTLRFSVCYHMGTTHFRTPFLLSSYLQVQVLSSIINSTKPFDVAQVSHFAIIASSSSSSSISRIE